MNSRLYTNTSNVKGIVGLLAVTVLTVYVSNHSDEIVEGSVALAKKSLEKVQELAHNGRKQVSVIERHFDGSLYDTGRRIWVRTK